MLRRALSSELFTLQLQTPPWIIVDARLDRRWFDSFDNFLPGSLSLDRFLSTRVAACGGELLPRFVGGGR
jgi:hypothetical protein